MWLSTHWRIFHAPWYISCPFKIIRREFSLHFLFMFYIWYCKEQEMHIEIFLLSSFGICLFHMLKWVTKEKFVLARQRVAEVFWAIALVQNSFCMKLETLQTTSLLIWWGHITFPIPCKLLSEHLLAGCRFQWRAVPSNITRQGSM